MANEKETQGINLAEKKEEFLKIFNTYIKRDGAQEVLWFLEHSDFFTAPASTKFHSAVEGGLFIHSLNVYYRLLNLVKTEYGENWEKMISHESVAICGLLHDVCKVNTYVVSTRNVKENNVWVQKPYYAIEDNLPYGHGEKSVYMLTGFMKLTREESMMINWHMGPYDLRVKGGSFALSDVFYQFPNALMMYLADVQASYFDETTEKYTKTPKEKAMEK